MKRISGYSLLTLAAAAMLAACSKEEPAPVLPDGGQRLAFTVTDGGYAPADAPRLSPSDAPATRAAENGYTTEFTAGDACGLYIVRGDEVVAVNVKLTASAAPGGTGAGLVWTADASAGTLWHMPGDSYYLYYPWQETPTDAPAEGATFTPSEMGDADAEFFAAMIAAWRPAADQSDYTHYTASDLMTAEGTAGASADGAVPLAFPMTHRMVLAVVELPVAVYKFGDYPDIDYSTCISEADFTGEAKPCPADGFYRYLVHPAVGAELTATYDDGTKHEFTVSIAGNSLKAGSYKTYKVDGIIVKEYATYAESGVVRIGDFYCTADGGSTGYLIPKEADEATVQSATVVGIVFQTDKSRIGAKEKEKLGGDDKVHGLVMSVKNAATSKTWGPYGTDEGLTKCESKAANYNDISGYGNCEHIRGNRGNFDSYPAFKAANEWNTTCPVPSATTGWYLPASGQWWDILQNLGGCPALADESEQTSSDGGNFTWSGQGDVPANLNRWIAHIADGNKNTFSSGDWFWSSSEYSSDRARHWYVGSYGRVYCDWRYKNYDVDVRPVLAF